MREAGFYWVRTCNANDWEIAYYNNHIGWHIACTAFQYREDEIHEIDERRIVRGEVK